MSDHPPVPLFPRDTRDMEIWWNFLNGIVNFCVASSSVMEAIFKVRTEITPPSFQYTYGDSPRLRRSRSHILISDRSLACVSKHRGELSELQRAYANYKQVIRPLVYDLTVSGSKSLNDLDDSRLEETFDHLSNISVKYDTKNETLTAMVSGDKSVTKVTFKNDRFKHFDEDSKNPSLSENHHSECKVHESNTTLPKPDESILESKCKLHQTTNKHSKSLTKENECKIHKQYSISPNISEKQSSILRRVDLPLKLRSSNVGNKTIKVDEDKSRPQILVPHNSLVKQNISESDESVSTISTLSSELIKFEKSLQNKKVNYPVLKTNTKYEKWKEESFIESCLNKTKRREIDPKKIYEQCERIIKKYQDYYTLKPSKSKISQESIRRITSEEIMKILRKSKGESQKESKKIEHLSGIPRMQKVKEESFEKRMRELDRRKEQEMMKKYEHSLSKIPKAKPRQDVTGKAVKESVWKHELEALKKAEKPLELNKISKLDKHFELHKISKVDPKQDTMEKQKQKPVAKPIKLEEKPIDKRMTYDMRIIKGDLFMPRLNLERNAFNVPDNTKKAAPKSNKDTCKFVKSPQKQVTNNKANIRTPISVTKNPASLDKNMFSKGEITEQLKHSHESLKARAQNAKSCSKTQEQELNKMKSRLKQLNIEKVVEATKHARKDLKRDLKDEEQQSSKHCLKLSRSKFDVPHKEKHICKLKTKLRASPSSKLNSCRKLLTHIQKHAKFVLDHTSIHKHSHSVPVCDKNNYDHVRRGILKKPTSGDVIKKHICTHKQKDETSSSYGTPQESSDSSDKYCDSISFPVDWGDDLVHSVNTASGDNTER